MIGLDTNVLVRYLAQDDPDQAARATAIFEQQLTEEAPGFIGLIVLVETVWVLQRLYRASHEEVRRVVADLLACRTIVVESRDAVAAALAIAEQQSCGFVDALIAASARGAGCKAVLSFDKGAMSAGMTLA